MRLAASVAEAEIRCPLAPSGRVLARWVVIPAHSPAADIGPTGRVGGPPLEPGAPERFEFDGAFDAVSMKELDASPAWQTWLLRAARGAARPPPL
jgi:hypothetical protein